jgi:translation initiation factor 4A
MKRSRSQQQRQEEKMASETADMKIFETFDDMGLPENLLRGVYAFGFQKPSEIQKRAIRVIMDGRDTICQAQSGTGKTGAFGIGCLSCVDPANPATQVLILAPTRELAQQIEGVVRGLGEYTKLTFAAATGGNPVSDDISAMRRGAQVVIGTPGRVYDLMERNVLRRNEIKCLVLDEADQMLEGRFRDQLECILGMGFPESTRVGLFSATMPDEVVDVANRLLKDPVRILLPPEKVTLDGISQFFVEVERDEWKFDCLCDIYQQININQAIIYDNTRQKVEWLAKRLQENKFEVGYIHGEMDPKERKATIKAFRAGQVRVLVSSDLLARGLDVQQVSLVINFALPPNRENYIHRIGRSGRFGRKGSAINLVTPAELSEMRDIEQFYSTSIAPLPGNMAEVLA